MKLVKNTLKKQLKDVNKLWCWFKHVLTKFAWQLSKVISTHAANGMVNFTWKEIFMFNSNMKRWMNNNNNND